MLQAFIIVLREVLEAALVIGIVLAASRGVPQRGLWVSAGVAAGILGSMVVAAFAEAIAMALEGVGQEIFNAGVLLVTYCFGQVAQAYGYRVVFLLVAGLTSTGCLVLWSQMRRSLLARSS